MKNKEYRYISLLCGLFVASLLTSNLLSAAKIVDLNLSFGGFSLILDAGTFLFPLCYIIGDLLTEVYGYQQAKKVIWIGFFCSLVFVLSIYGVQQLPAEENWNEAGGQKAYDFLLGGIANGGIIIASLSAYLVGEFSNAFLLAKIKVATSGKYLALRTITSSLVGQSLDSFIFILVASLFAIFSWDLFWSLFFSITVVKLLIEIAMTPSIYLAASFLKKAEKVDIYDKDL